MVLRFGFLQLYDIFVYVWAVGPRVSSGSASHTPMRSNLLSLDLQVGNRPVRCHVNLDGKSSMLSGS